MPARYRIQNNPSFEGLLSKKDLYLLVERGSLARGDFCADVRTGRSHKIGELIDGMAPPRPGDAMARIDRPPYQEFRADGPERADEEDPAGLVPPPPPDDDLPFTASGERIHLHIHPSWWAYSKPLVLFVLLGIASGLGFQFGTSYAFTGIGLALIVLLGIIAARFSCDFYVTDERVEVVWGIIGRSSKEVRVCDIRAIDVHERGIMGLLGIGTVDFSSAGNAGVEVQFRHIRKAHRIKELVRHLQRGTEEQ